MATWCRPKQTGCVKMVCSFQCCKSRRDESGRNPSKYCKKHTCAHFHMNEELPRCERPKDPSDSVCIYHARCPIDNCKKARIQIQIDILADEPRFKREKYCSDHTCLYEGCVEIRSTMGQGEVQYRPYCNEHVCHADGCAERNTKPLGGWYCQIHGCKKVGCSKEADNSRRYCEQHNRCEWSPSRCLNPKLSGKELCATHSQCETDGCQAWKEPDSPHCLKHSCGERGCKISSGNYKYCNEHRCENQDCSEHRAVRGRYCPRHSCPYSGCEQKRCYRGIYCTIHSCMHPDCGNVRGYGDFCETHYNSDCERRFEGRWDDDRRRLRMEVETRDIAIEGQKRLIQEQDEKIRRLQSGSGRYGINGLPN